MSEEIDFRVIELNKIKDFDEISPNLLVTEPWISEKECSYPQMILIETRRKANIEKLEILIHNSYIPKRVEIETNRASILRNDEKSFTKLGEVSFKEKKSSATKHELKTIYMDESLSRIRLKVGDNYLNRISNPDNQVGLMQLRLFGLYVPDEPENFSFKYIDERQKTGNIEGGLGSTSEAMDHKYTEEMLELGRILDRNKKRFVQEENFKKAKEAQLAQRLLKKATKEMEELEKDKDEAIHEEDFQRAQDLKDEMRTLRGNVLAAIDPKLLEYVPNDPGPSEEISSKPASLYDSTGSYRAPKLFKPIVLSPRSSIGSPIHHRLSSGTSDPFPPTPREDREKLSISPREPTPKPIGDLPLRPIRSPVRNRSPKPPTPIRSPTPQKIRSPTSQSSKSSHRPINIDSPVDFRRLHTQAETPNGEYFETRRPATRESYIPAVKTEKPRTRASSNRFYEKENMVVPAALRNRRSSDPEVQRRPRDREDSSKSGLNEHAFLDAIHQSDRSMAQRAIGKFGLSTVQKIYSKNYNHRREGLAELQRKLEDHSGQGSKSSEALDAALPLLSRSLRDTLYSVYSSALDVFRYIGKDYVPESGLEKTAPPKLATATAEPLISALGNSAKDQRFVSETEDVLSEVLATDPKMNKAFMPRLMAPFESSSGLKSDRSRAQIVVDRARDFGVPNEEAGFHEKTIGKFSISAMKHSDSQVKSIGKELFVMAYENGDRKTLRRMLPDDTPSTRNPIFRQLHEELDGIDGKRGEREKRTSSTSTDYRKSTSSSYRSSSTSNRSRSEDRERKVERKPLKSNLRPPSKGGRSRTAIRKQTSRRQSRVRLPSAIKSDSGEIDLDKMCMFCGQYNEEFDWERLDLHYLNECPMLRKCDKCNEVLEISSLKEHYLSECPSKEDFRQCPRCKEPIERPRFPMHISKRDCNLFPVNSSAGRCLLCHRNVIPNNDFGWQKHLIDDCPQNTRKPTNTLRGILKKRGSTSNGEQFFVTR